MTDKKIPRAIKQDLLDQLKKINPDINIAIEHLISVYSRKLSSHTENDYVSEADKIWKVIEKRIDFKIEMAITEARRTV